MFSFTTLIYDLCLLTSRYFLDASNMKIYFWACGMCSIKFKAQIPCQDYSGHAVVRIVGESLQNPEQSNDCPASSADKKIFSADVTWVKTSKFLSIFA
jgi:hypothetical protein